MNPVGVFVQVSDVFPDLGSDFATFRACLRQLSRTDTVFWCARLNAILSDAVDASHFQKQEFALQMFFGKEAIQRVNEFIAKRKKQGRDAENVAIVFRGQLLELLRWVCLICSDHPDDGSTYDDEAIRRVFAQALLLASDVWSRRVIEKGFSLGGGIESAREKAMGSIRQAVNDTFTGFDPYHALGRGRAIICDYLPQIHTDFAKSFQEKTGLSLEKYYLCVCAIMLSFLPRPSEGFETSISNTHIFNVKRLCESAPQTQFMMEQYLTLESQTIDELTKSLWRGIEIQREEDAPAYDFLSLRKRPIVTASDGRAIIVDPRFYAERATVGPLFLVSAAFKDDRPKTLALFDSFGRAFELYVFNILKQMYPDSASTLTQRLALNLRGTHPDGVEVQVADACLNDVTEIILFEIKASFIKDALLLDQNPVNHLDDLRSRYAVAQDENERPKGVAQLARAIVGIGNQEWKIAGQDFTKAQLVFPVLLVHDSLLEAPVYPSFLAKEFADALKADEVLRNGDMMKHRLRVKPLIVISIDTLEKLETSIEHFSLRDLLFDYCEANPDRMTSLWNFILSSKYKDRLYHSRSIATNALPLVEHTMRVFFPERSRPSA